MLLDNKNIVIIGGTSGIGLSAAKACIREGAQVVSVGLDEQSCQIAAKELQSRAKILQADACLPQTAQDAIALCKETFGSFNGLFHVAGGSGRKWGDGPLHELTLEGWNRTLALNLTSLMLSNQAAVQEFLAAASKGCIVNLSSVLAYAPVPQMFSTHAYASAKAAIIGFSQAIAAHYAPDDIRVNVIAPALVATPMSQRAQGNEKIMEFVRKKQPLDGGRIGQPEDLDQLVCSLLSDKTGFVTGQVIAVDGGWGIS
jgi:NAD(P)-dependent dehydrogenase (short-subunit alcohol dehydrogenase family)